MKEIKLTQGKVALVDDEDHERLSKFKWCAVVSMWGKRWIAGRGGKTINGKRKTIFMHREIMNTPSGLDTDHINHNSLDNRKCNLRICTRSENMCNRKGANRNSASKYLGVWWDENNKKWEAQIKVHYKQKYLGQFKSEKEAAIVRDKAAIELHGAFASLNFPLTLF